MNAFKPRAVVVCELGYEFDVIVADMINPGLAVFTTPRLDETNAICNRLAWSYRIRAVPLHTAD